MPESIRFKMTRKNLIIDWGLVRAAEGLYELYYLNLVHHPDIALMIEDLLRDITVCRFKLLQFHQRCWKSSPAQFDSIHLMGNLIEEAKDDIEGRGRECPGYFRALGALLHLPSNES